MQGVMQIRPLSPWSQHGQENLRYFTPVDRRIFLVISYGEVDLLLNGAISLTSEILINIRYACLTMETRGWPQLQPLGLPCSLAEAGMQTPSVEAPAMLNVLLGAASQSTQHPDGKSHGVRIKDGGDLHASLLYKAEYIFNKKNQRPDSKDPTL